MLTLFTLLKHISGLALIFFVVTFILVITDLENIATVAVHLWVTKLTLIAGFILINKWSTRKVAELKAVQQN